MMMPLYLDLSGEVTTIWASFSLTIGTIGVVRHELRPIVAIAAIIVGAGVSQRVWHLGTVMVVVVMVALVAT